MHRANPSKKVFFTPFSLSINVSVITRVDAFPRTINAIYWRQALTQTRVYWFHHQVFNVYTHTRAGDMGYKYEQVLGCKQKPMEWEQRVERMDCDLYLLNNYCLTIFKIKKQQKASETVHWKLNFKVVLLWVFHVNALEQFHGELKNKHTATRRHTYTALKMHLWCYDDIIFTSCWCIFLSPGIMWMARVFIKIHARDGSAYSVTFTAEFISASMWYNKRDKIHNLLI